MVRIAIITDNRLYREGLVELLRGRPEFDSVVGLPGDLDAIDSLVTNQIEVVLFDGHLEGAEEWLETARSRLAHTTFLVLALGRDLGEAVRWAAAGASGYVLQSDSGDQLVAAVLAVSRGELLCSPRIAAALLERVRVGGRKGDNGGIVSTPDSLTMREQQILPLIERGFSNKEIAASLGIELATAKNHVHRIFEKLHVRRRTQAAAIARRHRHLLPSDAAAPSGGSSG